jgi:hypothetical protein
VNGVSSHARVSMAFVDAASSIYREQGLRGFLRGSGARALYFMPSAAITWSTYEIVKQLFGVELEDSEDMFPI